MRPPLLLSVVSILTAAVACSTAGAASVPSNPTPLTLSATGPLPGCPTLDELDGSRVADKVRQLLARADTVDADQDEVGLYSTLIYTSLASSEAVTVAVCDPVVAAAGRPLESISGVASLAPAGDLVGFGLRARAAPITEAGSTMRVGDRYTLPVVGPQATVMVAVATASGARSLSLGPFESAPTHVAVAGTAVAPVVVVELASGATVRRVVEPPPRVTTSVSARPAKGRNPYGAVTFSVRAAPGAFVSTADRNARFEPEDLFDDTGAYFVAGASGRTSFGLFPDRSERSVDITVLDPVRRTLLGATCSFRRADGKVRTARCTRMRSVAPRVASPAAQLLTASRHRLPSAGEPTGRTASAARGPIVVGADLTVVDRVSRDEARGMSGLGGVSPLLGDVNGDGRPDLGTGDPLSGQALALSTSTGWNEVPVKAPFPDRPVAIPDLNGDGVDEMVAGFDEARVHAGSSAWAATPPRAFAFGPRVALGPADLALAAGDPDYGASRPFGLPDTTGDSRPEIAVVSPSESGIGVFASEGVPLGRKVALPTLQTNAIRDDIAALDAFSTFLGAIDDDEDTQLDPSLAFATLAPSTSMLSVRGGAVAADVSFRAEPQSNRAVSKVALQRLSFAAPWAFAAPGEPLEVAGVASVADYDPASGDVLLRTTNERCDRRLRCVVRFRRIDAGGRITATTSVRSDATGLTATFTNDGPDDDTRLDVLIHDDEYEGDAGPATPGIRGTIAVWPSAGPTNTATPALPVIGMSSAAPLTVGGPLSNWTAPDGRRSHAGRAMVGSRSRTSEQLMLIGALR